MINVDYYTFYDSQVFNSERGFQEIRFMYMAINKREKKQPRPQGLLLVQNGGRRNPWPRLPTWLQKFVRISLGKHDEMSSFRLDNGFRLQKINRAARR